MFKSRRLMVVRLTAEAIMEVLCNRSTVSALVRWGYAYDPKAVPLDECRIYGIRMVEGIIVPECVSIILEHEQFPETPEGMHIPLAELTVTEIVRSLSEEHRPHLLMLTEMLDCPSCIEWLAGHAQFLDTVAKERG
jgi:hypothetical protein